MHRNRSKDSQRKSSPPGPTYMSNDQIANYLSDLRTNRPARPNGSRPLPTKPPASMWNRNRDLPPRASSAMSSYTYSGARPSDPDNENGRSTSALSHRRPDSMTSFGSSAGRPLVQEPATTPVRKHVSPAHASIRSGSVSPSATYRESPYRRMERQEARSLRDALEEMDLRDEVRIYNAAQDEATELVWNHIHPGVPFKNSRSEFRNPDLDRSSNDTVKSGHTRSESLRGPRDSFRARSGLNFSSLRHNNSERRGRTVWEEDISTDTKDDTLRRRNRVNFALPLEDHPPSAEFKSNLPRPRNTSNDSSKGIFRNPNDQIYEEPQESPPRTEEKHLFARSYPSALKAKPRNSLPRGSRPLPSRFSNLPLVDKLSRFELHKQSPSQSRNPEYTTNDSIAETIPEQEKNKAPTKNGIEIRSDDIRAATSKKRADRSSNLPMPTAVSDRPGRPIVSFDRTWKPAEAPSVRDRDILSKRDSSPSSPPAAPAAPEIHISEEPPIPVINIPADREPTISEMIASQSAQKDDRPSSDQAKSRSRIPSPQKPAPASQDKWYTRYTRSGVPTATCAACSLPIAGKIVTAAGTRLHPECFVCHHCQTQLECVAFYQEPDNKRAERLAQASADDEQAQTLRFYCHLDYHELFSPRCKSCKTPIEGEVVIACGAEWHVGHFFCAECGDPFDAKTPFVEKDGFAWCLGCHSRRTAPRCLGCKQPVLDDVVVSAIGGQWHDKCFVCNECKSELGADGRFFVREGEPKRTGKGRIIGGPVLFAVCERCEGIRLKASPPPMK